MEQAALLPSEDFQQAEGCDSRFLVFISLLAFEISGPLVLLWLLAVPHPLYLARTPLLLWLIGKSLQLTAPFPPGVKREMGGL